MKKRLLAAFLVALSVITSGCSLTLDDHEETEIEKEEAILRDLGIISYEESNLGIPLNREDITSSLENEKYYILHDNVLYPCYTDIVTYEDEIESSPKPESRFNIYTSSSVVNIPTLFEGDKLLYYSQSGVLDAYKIERFKDLGWSIPIRDLRTTASGYVYVDTEDEDDFPVILDSLEEMRDIIEDYTLLIDKIGGIRLTSDYVEDGIIKNLIEGVSYDLEVYNGTNYYYLNTTVNTRYFNSMELYAEGEYVPLQDYLYEITMPDYLLDGYYNIDMKGMFRYVRGKEYNDETEFNERLLYAEEAGDPKGTTTPSVYSSIPELNRFKAYDETCFGYDSDTDIDVTFGFVEEQKEEGIANFIAASKTQTDLWLPKGGTCEVRIDSSESTGSIYIKMPNGRMNQVPYDRINKYYKVELEGNGEVVTLVVQGLFDNYTITLAGAEGYREQDKKTASEE